MPGALHAGFNQGFNCAESVNFASKHWLPLGRVARSCNCARDSVRINMNLFNGIYEEEEEEASGKEESKADEEEEEEEEEEGGVECADADMSARKGRGRARVVLKPLRAASACEDADPERPTKIPKKIVFRVKGAVS